MEEMIKVLVTKLDRIDEKLDLHMERIARVEEQTKSNTGMVRILITGIITVLGGVIITLFKSFGK